MTASDSPGRLTREQLEQMMISAVEVLDFYADPATYHAIGFFPDPPCGNFMDDFSPVEEYDGREKPGKRARALLDEFHDAVLAAEGETPPAVPSPEDIELLTEWRSAVAAHRERFHPPDERLIVAGSWFADRIDPPSDAAVPSPEMPAIEQGDILVYMDDDEIRFRHRPAICLHLHRRNGGDPPPAVDKIVAVYRMPLWRRP